MSDSENPDSDTILKRYGEDDGSSSDERNDFSYGNFEVSSSTWPPEGEPNTDEGQLTTSEPYTGEEDALEQMNPGTGQGVVNASRGISDPSSHWWCGGNYSSESTDAPGAQVLGAGTPKTSYKQKDIQCPLFKRGDNNYCYKGASCGYMHLPFNSKYLSAWGTRIQKACVARASNFKLKIPLHVKSEQQVKVSFVQSPDIFHVTKEKGDSWLCDCEMANNSSCKDKPITAQSLTDKLTSSMTWRNILSLAHRSANFTVNEMVAVKVRTGSNTKYYRGLMLETVRTLPTESIEHKKVLVNLIDTGETTLMPLSMVRKYLEKMGDIEPPMAYKCQLTGVVPVFDHWSPEACQYFRETVTAKNVVVRVEVVNTVLYGKGAYLEEKPYAVKLFTGFEDVQPIIYEDVVEKLVRMGHGVALTSTPQLPEACKNDFSMRLRSDWYEQNKLVLATKKLYL